VKEVPQLGARKWEKQKKSNIEEAEETERII